MPLQTEHLKGSNAQGYNATVISTGISIWFLKWMKVANWLLKTLTMKTEFFCDVRILLLPSLIFKYNTASTENSSSETWHVRKTLVIADNCSCWTLWILTFKFVEIVLLVDDTFGYIIYLTAPIDSCCDIGSLDSKHTHINLLMRKHRHKIKLKITSGRKMRWIA